MPIFAMYTRRVLATTSLLNICVDNMLSYCLCLCLAPSFWWRLCKINICKL